jgi:NRPS condensation-like uncharacterized protein
LLVFYLRIYIEERDIIITNLNTVRLRWLKKDDKHQQVAAAAAVEDSMTLPVYLNSSRKDVLFSAEFKLAAGQKQAALIEKGVAIIANA